MTVDAVAAASQAEGQAEAQQAQPEQQALSALQVCYLTDMCIMKYLSCTRHSVGVYSAHVHSPLHRCNATRRTLLSSQLPGYAACRRARAHGSVRRMPRVIT